MELKSLGFDDWFQNKLKEYDDNDYDIARITAVNRDNYLVRNEDSEVLGELSGRFRFFIESEGDLPTVGDWVLTTYLNTDTFAIIEHLLPRKTVLKRKVAGKKISHQMIAANIDTAFVIQSCDFNFNLRRLERYLVAIREGNIEPVVLLSKSDLVSQSELDEIISATRDLKINSRVIAYSVETDIGLKDISQLLKPCRTFCLLGSSGVGKTTLINHLVGDGMFATKSVRRKDSKGRHTTTRRQLICLKNGAMLIDTPGLREFGNIGVDSGIVEVFPDIKYLADGCRFKNCSHTSEAGCSVLEAVKNGSLCQSRYNNYLKLKKESEYYQLSYVEKRKKDRQFGRFIKYAKKTMSNK